MAQLCPAKSTIVPFKKQMYSSGSIILSYKDDKCICVSIHAPTRGATKMVCRVDYRGCFNPRTHEGCDSGDAMPDIKAIGFNPRTHEGCDRDNRIGNHLAVVSIHAPTRGATPSALNMCAPTVFQSTHPRGVRLLSHGLDETRLVVSIHAPTRGATKFCSNQK